FGPLAVGGVPPHVGRAEGRLAIALVVMADPGELARAVLVAGAVYRVLGLGAVVRLGAHLDPARAVAVFAGHGDCDPAGKDAALVAGPDLAGIAAALIPGVRLVD